MQLNKDFKDESKFRSPMGSSPDWGSGSWPLTKEAAVAWRLAESWVDVDTGWVLIVMTSVALHQCLSVVLVVTAGATNLDVLLRLLVHMLMLGGVLLDLRLVDWLLRLLLVHGIHAPVDVLFGKRGL